MELDWLKKKSGICLQHGRPRSGLGQHLCGTALAERRVEDVYLRGYVTVPELRVGLTDYFVFYNTERRCQSLNYVTSDEVYRTASGGGARIVDQFGKIEHIRLETQKETECRGSAVPLRVNGYTLKLNALLS